MERNCGRFEWAVLDWNAQAIAFYQGLGATLLPDWRIVRMVGPALTTFAAGIAPPPLGIQSPLGSVEASDPAGKGDAR